MKTVAPWVVWVKPSWRRFAQHFTRFGDASLAAEHVGYRGSNARHQGVALMTKPEVLLACFEEIERRRQEKGPAPHEDAVRKLIDAAAECLRPGATQGRSARWLPNLLQASREFCRRQGLTEDGLFPEAMIDALPAPEADALPPCDLAPAFRPLQGRSRYKGAHGGRGSGKSHAFAELLVRRCIEAAPVRAVCIREVLRSLDQSVKRLIEDKIQALGVGRHFQVQADRILYRGVISFRQSPEPKIVPNPLI